MMIIDPDLRWFLEHRGRQTHIRYPVSDEFDMEFRSIGAHDFTRRRVICWKVPGDVTVQFRSWVGKIIKIPFVAFADESIRDDDETLLPMLNEIMVDAAKRQGMTA